MYWIILSDWVSLILISTPFVSWRCFDTISRCCFDVTCWWCFCNLLRGPGKQFAHHSVHSSCISRQETPMPNVIDCLFTFVHWPPSLPLRQLHQSLHYPSLLLLFSCGWTVALSCTWLHPSPFSDAYLPPSTVAAQYPIAQSRLITHTRHFMHYLTSRLLLSG